MGFESMGVKQSCGLGIGGKSLSVAGGSLRGPRIFKWELQNSVEYRRASRSGETYLMIQLKSKAEFAKC